MFISLGHTCASTYGSTVNLKQYEPSMRVKPFSLYLKDMITSQQTQNRSPKMHWSKQNYFIGSTYKIWRLLKFRAEARRLSVINKSSQSTLVWEAHVNEEQLSFVEHLENPESHHYTRHKYRCLCCGYYKQSPQGKRKTHTHKAGITNLLQGDLRGA